MKKIILLLAAAAITSGALAEGYQVNNLSSKQNGMGHVGTALKLNSESLYFNPAGAAFQTSKFDISAGMTGVASSCTFTNIDYTGENRISAKTDNDIATPMYVYFNYKPTERLGIGVSFTTPFGSSMNWPSDWTGAHLIQSIDLKAYQVQPTVSYKICDKLSAGIGLTIAWGSFDLSRAMFPVGAKTNNTIAALLTAKQMGQYAPLFTAAGNHSLLSAKLEAKASVAVGVNLGLMWDINDEWTLGFSYRSRLNMKVDKGTAELN
ncbi:MAG: outer membrane protein transport protein, partial [Alistipes sp.]